MSKTVERTPKNGEPLCSPRNKFQSMREGADKNSVQYSFPATVSTEVKEAGSSPQRDLNRQEQLVSPVVYGTGRPDIAMPARAPLWYRHWGLNE
jgi:hypothetical protein